MDVILHNGIERCPKQCVSADIKTRGRLIYGTRKASIVGVEVFVSCAHASVCRRIFEQLAEKVERDA